jgi:tRNA1Val (adenine37-N6)-methyltransferase
MASPFIFKQFSLEQSKSAFKLGTDSVLLGAWLPKTDYQQVLDVGSGTGILSLMMAQRFTSAIITAVEIDQESVSEMTNNFAQSEWKDRLTPVHNNIVDWSNANFNQQFNLIISNPPYFTSDLQNPDTRKANARHTGDLNSVSMAGVLKKHLNQSGHFACILPSLEFDQWRNILHTVGLKLAKICHVRSFKNSEVVRKIGIFSFEPSSLISEDCYIYNDDKSRSDWYANITSEFYIK